MAIDRIAPGSEPALIRPAAAAAAAGAPVDFGAALEDVMSALEGSTSNANQAIGRMVDGTGDVHEAMIALQKADMMLQLTVQVRNKIVQAYQDIMRMPV